ncbi:MAG: 4Fe-4S binding protein [Actinomycetota bacterium]|nr:4Fe-4S binding protein [Actinomycetota bacterium]
MGYSSRVVNIFLTLWPFTHLVKRLSPYTPFRQLFAPLVREEIFQVTFLPVAEEVPTPREMVLPRQVLARLIEEASHRFIYNNCICRTQEGCSKYPSDLGCLFLGDAAAHLHPSLGHRAGIEECLEHLERASEAGLVGMMGHLWMDATALGVMHRFHRFLVVCFCCDCCCMVRTDLREAGPEFKRTIKKLDAVKVRVTGECRGCGTCVETCFVGAISLRGDRAFIDPESCKGCGRCAMVCPQKAIEVDFDDGDAVWRELLDRVRHVLRDDTQQT